MANVIYDEFYELLQEGTTDWDTETAGNFMCSLVESTFGGAGSPANTTASQGGAPVTGFNSGASRTQDLATLTFDAATRSFRAAQTVFSNVADPGNPLDLLIWHNSLSDPTGVAGTNTLVCWTSDSRVSANGTTITVDWDATNGVFNLNAGA